MRKLGALILLAASTVALAPAGPALAQGPLRADTEHVLVVPPVFDGVYMLAWQGTIKGDITGCIQWWIDTTRWTSFPAPKNPAQASHYTGSKGLVFEGECGDSGVILEFLGHGRGTTTMANMSWRANSVVVYADPDLFPDWEGRRVHENGTFDMAFDEDGNPVSATGTSTFRIN